EHDEFCVELAIVGSEQHGNGATLRLGGDFERGRVLERAIENGEVRLVLPQPGQGVERERATQPIALAPQGRACDVPDAGLVADDETMRLHYPSPRREANQIVMNGTLTTGRAAVGNYRNSLLLWGGVAFLAL